eukprot:403339614
MEETKKEDFLLLPTSSKNRRDKIKRSSTINMQTTNLENANSKILAPIMGLQDFDDKKSQQLPQPKLSDPNLNTKDLMNTQPLKNLHGGVAHNSSTKKLNQSFKLAQRTNSVTKKRGGEGLFASQDKIKKFEIDKNFIHECEQQLSKKVPIPPNIDPETFEQVLPSTQFQGIMWIFDKLFNSPYGVRPKDLQILQQLFNQSLSSYEGKKSSQNIDQQILQTQGDQYFEGFKNIIDYINDLKDNSKKLIKNLKEANLEMKNLHLELAKSIQNVIATNLSKSKFSKDAENNRKDDTQKQLQQKDQEIEEYRQKFEVMKQAMKQLEVNKDQNFIQIEMPQTSIDVDYAQKISYQNQEFNKAHRLLGGLQAQIYDTMRSVPTQILDESNRESMITALQNQYEKLREVQDTFVDENSALYEKKTELASRLDTLQKNTKFLENKLATTLTEKEEQIIKLKSEIIIYKNKIIAYKTKLRDSVNGYETKKLSEMHHKQENEIQQRDVQISNLELQLENLTLQNSEMTSKIEQQHNQIEQDKDQNQAQIYELNLIITQLSTRLQDIDKDHSQQLSKVDTIRDITQKRLNIEEKERSLNSLKLEYLINNYKKLQLQQRFLETTLEKDMKNLTQELRKAELEVQREVYVTSQSAQQRLNSMYSIIKESLRYVKDVIGFMNFDVDRVQDQEYLKLENELRAQKEQVGIVNTTSQPDPIARFEQLRDQARGQENEENKRSSSQLRQEANQTPQPNQNSHQIVSLDQCYYKHIYELAEVLLSILSEIYKDSRTQTPLETVQLFTLLQQKTNKTLVSEIYNKYFASSRIHFAQFMNKQNERTFDLQNERTDLKMQIHRLNQQVQELITDQDRDQQEELRQLHQQQQQEQQQLHDLGLGLGQDDEELKEQDLGTDSVVFAGSGNVASPSGMSGQSTNKMALGSGHFNMNPRASLDIPRSQALMMQLQRHQTMTQNNRDDIPGAGVSGQQNINNNNFSQNVAQQQQQQHSTGSALRDLLFHKQQSTSLPSGGRQSPAAVASVLFKSQEKRIVELITSENMALKEKVRETRLVFQRQITELQDQIKMLKDQHFQEFNKLKIEYGKDLGILHKSQKQRELELRDGLEAIQKEEIDEMLKKNQEFISKIKQDDQERYDLLRQKLEKTEMIRVELDRELKKLKKQSNLVAQGGWGTFAIAIETMPKKYNFQGQSNTLLNLSGLASPSKSSIDPFKENAVRKLSTQSSKEDNQLDVTVDKTREELSLKQLTHFIQVGFLMDSKNFNFIDCYKEKTYDSQLTKYLFEFQDPISNHQMLTLQTKIKQQLVENFALFNEINPVYITLNLGRTISPFYGDDSLSMDQFKLIKREGVELNGGQQQLMVNFLRCEEPQMILRVIAFDNERFQQHSFDLVFEDLMLLVDGNMKLLEDDHIGDLCQIILNNLTMIKRGNSSNSKKNKKQGKQPSKILIQDESISKFDEDTSMTQTTLANPAAETLLQRRQGENSVATIQINSTVLNDQATLAVEHKLFFNEYYKIEYDKPNRVILGKHDKKKKGLVQEKSVSTEFDKSIIYEAFEVVYQDKILFQIDSGDNSTTITRELEVCMKRGKMSQHMIFNVQYLEVNYNQDIMLYFTEYSRNNQTQQVSSEIVKLPSEIKSSENIPMALVVSYEKIYGLDHFVIRLVIIQNCDAKTMTEYKWDPVSAQQFGSLKYHTETLYLVKQPNSQFQRMTNYEILNTEIRSLLFMHTYGYQQSLVDFGKLKALENVEIKTPLEKQQFGSMQLIFREFGVVRIKHLKESQKQLRNKRKSETLELNQQSDMDDDSQVESEEEEEEAYYENNFCVFAFYDDLSCLNNQEIHIHLKIHGQNQQELHEKISIAEIQNDIDFTMIRKDQEKVCKQIFDQIVVFKKGGHLKVQVDKQVQPMSKLIEEIKRKKFLAQIDSQDILQTELDSKQIQISLSQLAECPKLTTVSIINRKVFKITAYFLSNLKNLKLAQAQNSSKKSFDWQVVYIDCYQRLLAKSHILIVTEKDLIDIYESLKSQLNSKSQEEEQLLQIYQENELFSQKFKKERLIEFILDCLVFDENKQSIQVSITHLKSRLEDRLKLSAQFRLSGSKFISKTGQIDDPENLIYNTSLPQIEMSRKLLLNVEKEFSDKKYDIKIFELSLKNRIDEKKYILEMFCPEQPNAIFKAEYFSQVQMTGKKLMMERFNIIQQMHQDYEENKFMRDGMVLGIIEQSFPHEIVFILLEPASHIQWQYTVRDDKLNQIETRIDKEFFVEQATICLQNCLLKDIENHTKVQSIQELGYQKDMYDQGIIQVWQGNLKSQLNESNQLMYAKNIELQLKNGESAFFELNIISMRIMNAIKIVILNKDQKSEVSCVIETQRESSRYFSGFINLDHFNTKLLYTIGTSQAYTQQEKAIRFTLQEPQLSQKLCDVIFSEHHLLNQKQTQDNTQTLFLKDELKFAFTIGFKDSFALFQKLPDIVTDFKKAFIQPQKRLEYSRLENTSRLLYRKVCKVQDSTLIIQMKFESLETAEKEWILLLFDQKNSYQEQFKFKLDQILNKDELNSLNINNDRIVKDIVQRLVDKRLKIKIIEGKNEVVQMASSIGSYKQTQQQTRYLAYFLDPPLGSASDKKQPQLQHSFDIRNGFRFSLMDSESMTPEVVIQQSAQERIIVQLEKDDLLFDISELLSPYELILRIKTYLKDSLKMISSSDIKELDIRKELVINERLGIIPDGTTPQRRTCKIYCSEYLLR